MGAVEHSGQGLWMLVVGFAAGGLAAYLSGRAVFRWLTRAGLIRNAQWYVDPIDALGGDHGSAAWRWVKGYYKFQQIAHLAAATPVMLVASVMFVLTIIYYSSWVDPSLWGMVQALPDRGPAALLKAISSVLKRGV